MLLKKEKPVTTNNHVVKKCNHPPILPQPIIVIRR